MLDINIWIKNVQKTKKIDFSKPKFPQKFNQSEGNFGYNQGEQYANPNFKGQRQYKDLNPQQGQWHNNEAQMQDQYQGQGRGQYRGGQGQYSNQGRPYSQRTNNANSMGCSYTNTNPQYKTNTPLGQGNWRS